MPEARQNNSKLAEMFDRASNFGALVGIAVDVVNLCMALLSSVESAPRAYRRRFFHFQRDRANLQSSHLLSFTPCFFGAIYLICAIEGGCDATCGNDGF